MVDFDANKPQNEIPIEIVSEEEMALIEAAFSLAAAAHPELGQNLRPIDSISNRALPTLAESYSGSDIEDLGELRNPKKKCKMSDSPLIQFKKKGLYVTDITTTEWCEKQMDFILHLGKPRITNAMKVGISRHTKLEEEVIMKVEVNVESSEDIWALKFMNFIICANQLLFEGLARELPVVGLIQGVWIVGVIDELRMPVTGNDRVLTLVDTKTRVQPRLPAEPQRRNGRLQLMCYKILWDNLVSGSFPSKEFFDFFSLDSQRILSDEIKRSTSDSGFSAATLGEVVRYFSNACSVLPPAHDQLLLRYELQEDNSLIGEDEFAYDDDWSKAQIHNCLEFWQGKRKAKFVSEDERWKCRFCRFASVCPSQNATDAETSSQITESGSNLYKSI